MNGLMAADNDQFLLRGQVLSSCFVSITVDANATNLDLTGAGHAGTHVANVQLTTNAAAFASVIAINDDTGSLLVNTADPTKTIPYTFNYTSTDTGTTNNGFSVPSPTPLQLDFIIGNGGFSGDIGINLVADPTLVDGTYEANVTVACAII